MELQEYTARGLTERCFSEATRLRVPLRPIGTRFGGQGSVAAHGDAREDFALKAFASSRIILHLRGQKVQPNMPAQLEIFTLVNRTHTATTELFQDAIMRDGFADHETPADSCGAAGPTSEISFLVKGVGLGTNCVG
jgi:hypothetical protein